MKNGYLGIYDSGIGGLTVVKAVQEAFPHQNVIFLADSKNMPYGSKTPQQIVSYSLNNVSILNRYPLKAILIACNTSDSIARKTLQEECDLPIFGVIDPAARKAVSLSENRRIAVLATQATCASGAYVRAIQKYDEEAEVVPIPCPLLVPLIEEGRCLQEDEEFSQVLLNYLQEVRKCEADTLILGCTHYDVLYEQIGEILPDIRIVSSSRCIVNDLQDLLSDDPSNRKDKDIYLCTSESEQFRETAKLILPEAEFQSI